MIDGRGRATRAELMVRTCGPLSAVEKPTLTVVEEPTLPLLKKTGCRTALKTFIQHLVGPSEFPRPCLILLHGGRDYFPSLLRPYSHPASRFPPLPTQPACQSTISPPRRPPPPPPPNSTYRSLRYVSRGRAAGRVAAAVNFLVGGTHPRSCLDRVRRLFRALL